MPSLAEHLASQFTVIAYDRRGRGESADTLPYAVDREIDDLQALIGAAGGSAFVHGFSSGAVLALEAAASGLAIPKLTLLEPPLSVDNKPPSGRDLGAEVAKLIVVGRRSDAFEHWMNGIGVPAEMISGMRQAPYWPSLELLAHTLVYDSIVLTSLPVASVPAITTPTMVLASDASSDQLRKWAQGVSDTLPNGSIRILKGVWHGVSPEVLAPVMTEFLIGR
jgi:pimeloyl-ACP methyl ester carboxylesterase